MKNMIVYSKARSPNTSLNPKVFATSLIYFFLLLWQAVHVINPVFAEL